MKATQAILPHDAHAIHKEFSFRRQTAVKCSFREITARVIGFVDWMNTLPVTKRLLRQLRIEGNAEELMYDKTFGRTYYRKDIQARTIEQIAAVGLALINHTAKAQRPFHEIGRDFGIFSDRWNGGSDADSDAVVSRYITPFLDYIERRLPEVSHGTRLGKQLNPPALIVDSLSKFSSQHRKVGGRCFIMMRFGKTKAHSRIENAIKGALKRHGLIGLLARDKDFHEDLYPNILTYMHGCDFGVAVFERLETEIFNPNVALEVGYMLGLKKHVLLLKDQTLHALHTDLVGKLYREFDPQKPATTIPKEIDKWLTDKGLA